TPQQLMKEDQDRLKADGIWYPGIWEQTILDQPVPPTNQPIFYSPQNHLYRKKKSVLSWDELQIYQQDWIVVTGANGSGKTSFFLHLMGFLSPHPSTQWIDEPKKILLFQNPENQFLQQ